MNKFVATNCTEYRDRIVDHDSRLLRYRDISGIWLKLALHLKKVRLGVILVGAHCDEVVMEIWPSIVVHAVHKLGGFCFYPYLSIGVMRYFWANQYSHFRMLVTEGDVRVILSFVNTIYELRLEMSDTGPIWIWMQRPSERKKPRELLRVTWWIAILENKEPQFPMNPLHIIEHFERELNIYNYLIIVRLDNPTIYSQVQNKQRSEGRTEI